jgi:hypothetical protein
MGNSIHFQLIWLFDFFFFVHFQFLSFPDGVYTRCHICR